MKRTRAEIAALKVERDAYHQDRDNWRASCKQVENERDAAYVRGLERARSAIDAEIDKAKAGK